jgi:putative ABC transport system permease protein
MSQPDADPSASPGSNAAGAAGSIPALAWSLARQWFFQLAALTAACAVVAATIAGALGVGDALQGGLRALALERLGGIVATVVADDFVRADLAREGSRGAGPAVIPAIVLEVALDAPGSTGRDARSARATLLACDQATALGFDPEAPAVGRDEVAINEVLARNLGVSTGETVVLRIAKRSDVPADSPLGRRTMESLGRRLRVVAVLPARGIGRFSLRPAQVTGGMALVSLSTAQEVLRRGDVANAAFAVGDVDPEAIRQTLHPTLEDYGLNLEEMAGGALRLSSRRLLLPAEVDRAAAEVLEPLGGKRTLAFLVNEIGVPASAGLPAASIPYSTVLGVDTPSLPVGSLLDASGGELSVPDDVGIVIDQWMADDFAAQGHPVAPGDHVDVRLFRSETLHGRVEEITHRLRITAVARMEGAAVARSLVPEVEGITDEKSIADWDPPFPFDRAKVRTVPPHDEDDRYWKAHGATPKAFVSLGCGERLAGSRFGATTAWFVPPTSRRAEVAAELAGRIVPERLGLRVEASRRDALAAAKGSTPFGGLFLALSSFVVAAGLLLEWLLFALLVAARRRDIGVLAAIGWPAARITGLLVLVGALAAAVGGIVGTAVGPAWARLLLGALSSSWNASVAAGSSSAFGDGVIRWTSLWPGAMAGFLLSMAAIVSAARRAGRQKPLTLLRGGGDAAADRPRAGRRALVVALLSLAGALAVAALAGRLEGQAAVGTFFLSGVLALVGLLSLVRLLLTRGPGGRAGLKSLVGLAWRGLAHRPSRAFSIAAIVAVAEFLIVAVSAFSLSSPPRPRERSGPTGGWTSIATFAAPTAVNPADADAAAELGLSDDARQTLAGATLEPIRASAGDDASCTNLYAPARPIVLGVGPRFVARGGFRFTGHAPLPSSAETNPWQLLGRTGGGPIPAILDDATARWALKLGGVGARFTLPDDEGTLVEFEIVGLLEPGILQGWVIVAESDFQSVFPSRSGAAMALIDAGEEPLSAVDRAASAAWVDAGVTIQPTLDRLRSLSAVQNTFLAAFQALGTLGLLLGTAGVAAAQVQGVLERIGSFGLLGAIGFPPARLRAIVLLETCFMVGLGLAAGALAGAVTLPAHIAGGRASVPLAWIALTCGLTLLVALLAGLLATRSVARLAPRDALAARG